jgi:hypothetical protein
MRSSRFHLVRAFPRARAARRHEWEDVHPVTGETHSYYANEVTALEEERAAHPFRIEVWTMQDIVHTMQEEILSTDAEYLETFEHNHFIEQAQMRRNMVFQITAEERRVVTEIETPA